MKIKPPIIPKKNKSNAGNSMESVDATAGTWSITWESENNQMEKIDKYINGKQRHSHITFKISSLKWKIWCNRLNEKILSLEILVRIDHKQGETPISI